MDELTYDELRKEKVISAHEKTALNRNGSIVSKKERFLKATSAVPNHKWVYYE